MFLSFQNIYPHKLEAVTEKSIQYFIVFFMSFFSAGAFSNTLSNTRLDRSGRGVKTDSRYYQDKTNRLKGEIADTNSQISDKQNRLEHLRRTCRPGSKNNCDSQITSLENQISNLEGTLQQQTAEKARAEENYANTAEFEQALREAVEASQDAASAAKKKVKKQKKLLKTTAIINTGAAAALFYKCYSCSPSCTIYCGLGALASLQAMETLKQSRKLGGIENKLSNIGGSCHIFPSACAPLPDLCQTDPDACNPPQDICQTDPSLCPMDPSTPPEDICQTNPEVCNPPEDICQTDPDACAPPPPGGGAPEPPEPPEPPPNPKDCTKNPSLPHCSAVHPCPNKASEECITMIQPCPTGEEQCKYTTPTDPGAFAGQTPPLTIEPIKGGAPMTVSTDISDIDMNDPRIKKTLEELKKKQAPLYKQLAALGQDLGLPSSADGGFGSDGAYFQGSGNLMGTSGKSKKGAGEFAGNSINLNGGEGGDSKKESGKKPYKNLISQFRGRKKLKRDLVGEKSITFGEDKIGVTEDNIFLMVHKTYQEHRKADEFIEEDPAPAPKTSESSL